MINANMSGSIASLPINMSQLEGFAERAGIEPPAKLAEALESRKAEIESAAHEFESVFLSLMLKEMRNTLDQENGGLFGGESSDTFGGMFDLFMSQHLSESKPLGIANAVETYMKRSLTDGAEVDGAELDGAKLSGLQPDSVE